MSQTGGTEGRRRGLDGRGRSCPEQDNGHHRDRACYRPLAWCRGAVILGLNHWFRRCSYLPPRAKGGRSQDQAPGPSSRAAAVERLLDVRPLPVVPPFAENPDGRVLAFVRTSGPISEIYSSDLESVKHRTQRCWSVGSAGPDGLPPTAGCRLARCRPTELKTEPAIVAGDRPGRTRPAHAVAASLRKGGADCGDGQRQRETPETTANGMILAVATSIGTNMPVRRPMSSPKRFWYNVPPAIRPDLPPPPGYRRRYRRRPNPNRPPRRRPRTRGPGRRPARTVAVPEQRDGRCGDHQRSRVGGQGHRRIGTFAAGRRTRGTGPGAAGVPKQR
jgi:hypothetical protein